MEETINKPQPVLRVEKDKRLVAGEPQIRTMRNDMGGSKSKEVSAPDVPEPVKESQPKKPDNHLKITFITLASIIAIGLIGGFFYWWNYLRPVSVIPLSYYTCVNGQCVKMEGDGVDACLIDADCVVASESPDSLIPVGQTETVDILSGQESSIFDDLRQVAESKIDNGVCKRVLIRRAGIEKKDYVNLTNLFEYLSLIVPEGIKSAMSDEYTVVLCGQSEGNRFGMAIKLNDTNMDMASWESEMIVDLGGFIVLSDKFIDTNQSGEFQDNVYQNASIRYVNFPNPALSIDYAVIGDLLVFATSKESMYSIINAFNNVNGD